MSPRQGTSNHLRLRSKQPIPIDSDSDSDCPALCAPHRLIKLHKGAKWLHAFIIKHKARQKVIFDLAFSIIQKIVKGSTGIIDQNLDFTVGSTGIIDPCQYFIVGSGGIIDPYRQLSLGSGGIIDPPTGSMHMSAI